MNIVSIDLSLRSTALVFLNQTDYTYELVKSDSKKLNDEKLLQYNWNCINSFIAKHKPDIIAIEGLSFNSVSSSKDLIAGNFWFIRTMIDIHYPDIKLIIVPVLTWRNPLFNKEERKELKDNTKKLKDIKKLIKDCKDKADKQKLTLDNEELILKSNIKYLTWEKLPIKIREEFNDVGFTKGCFDLTDAYFIAKHIQSGNKI